MLLYAYVEGKPNGFWVNSTGIGEFDVVNALL